MTMEINTEREWHFIVSETHNNKDVGLLARELLFSLQILLPKVTASEVNKLIYLKTKSQYLSMSER
jgi:hypothetical protein